MAWLLWQLAPGHLCEETKCLIKPHLQLEGEGTDSGNESFDNGLPIIISVNMIVCLQHSHRQGRFITLNEFIIVSCCSVYICTQSLEMISSL